MMDKGDYFDPAEFTCFFRGELLPMATELTLSDVGSNHLWHGVCLFVCLFVCMHCLLHCGSIWYAFHTLKLATIVFHSFGSCTRAGIAE